MNENNRQNSTNINWYPGHMAKTKRLIKENLNHIDIVYEVIDSRMPYSSKIVDIDDIIKNKQRILVMTKYDLCDTNETDRWIKHYQNKGYQIVKFDLIKDNVQKLIDLTINTCDINEKRISKGMKPRKIRTLIIGVPNVGKSTLINRLVSKKAVTTGNIPGVTKNLNWIRINDSIELLDTPGILWPKIEDEKVGLNLASLTSIKEEVIPIDEVIFYLLNTLYKHYPNILKERYDIANIDDITIVLEKIGKKRGCLVKGGEVDYDKVYSVILKDIKDGLIKGITLDRMDEHE